MNNADIKKLVIDTFVITPSVNLHLIDSPKPETPFDIVGFYNYYTMHDLSPKQQFFLISVRDCFFTPIRSREETMVKKLGQKLEAFMENNGLKITDIKLPKKPGFSGRKHLFDSSI